MRRARSLLVLIALVLLIPFALAHNGDQCGPGKKHPPRDLPPGRKLLVTGVTADPNPFSPNADGRLDTATISVEGVVKASDGLHARDHDRDDGDDGRASFYFAATAVIGDDVRRLRARSEIPRTPDRSVRVRTETAFDGNDETGRLLPDGDYDSTVLAFFLRERIKEGALSGEARSRLDDLIYALAGERNATIGLESRFEKRRKGRGEGSWRAEVRVDGIGKALRHKIRPLIEALEAALVAARQEVKAKIKLIDSEVVDGNALTIDTTAPALVSLLPPDGFASPSPEVEIAGSLSEPATLSINDLPIPLLPDLSFSATFPLSGGANLFAITAEDLAGNRTETSRTYLFDVTPPFIDIAEPIPGSFVPNNLPTIRVVYSDPEPSSGLDLSSLAILLDGTPLPLTPDRIGPTEAIFVPTNPLNDGEHTIEATISDKAPNVGTAGPYAFSIDTLPPTLTLSEPPDWLVTNRLSTLVSGTSSEAGTVTVNSRTFPLAFAETGGLTGVTGFIFPPALTPDTTSPTGYVLSQSPLSYQGRDFDQLPNDEGGIIEDVALFLPTGFEPGGSEPPPILMQSFTPVPVDGLVAVHLALVEGSAGDRVTIYTTMERTELEAFLAMVDPVGATIWLYRQDAFLPQGPGAAYVFNPPPPGGGAGAWAFTTVEPLAEGANVISVFATDPAGHVSAPIVRHASLDSIPPVIRLDQPPQNFLTNRPSILVRGALSEEAEVWVNDIRIPLGGSPLPMVAQGFDPPSLVPGGSIPLVESFDSGLTADWSVVNLVGPPAVVGPPALVIPAQGALYVDTGPQAAGTSGSMLLIVRTPGAPVDVSQGFHLSVEFRVEVLEGTGGFGVSLKGERGGVEESLMQARIGLDPNTLLPVAYLSATRPSGEQAMQIGLLGAIAPGTLLRFDLSYDAALHKVTARMMDESRTLFDRSVGGFVVDFPVGVVLNVFAAEVGGGVAPGSVPLTSDSRVAVAIDNLVSDILVPGGYVMSVSPMELVGTAYADIPSFDGMPIPGLRGTLFLPSSGTPVRITTPATPVPGLSGTEDVNAALVESQAGGVHVTVYSPLRCPDALAVVQRTLDPSARLAGCVEPILEAQSRGSAYALATPDPPVTEPFGFQTRIRLAEGNHVLTVTSRDRAGNMAIPVARAVTVDVQPPRVVVHSLPLDFRTAERQVALQVSYSDTFTGVDPATLMISVNGADVTPPLPGPSFVEFTVEPGDGVHTLFASISDRAGNTGQVGPTFFTVDSTPPEIVVDSPAPGAVITVSDVPFRVGYFDALVGVNTATLRIEVDGEDATPPMPGAYQVDFTRTLEDGTHTLAVSVSDALGNAATTGPIIFIVDTSVCNFALLRAFVQARSTAEGGTVRRPVTPAPMAPDFPEFLVQSPPEGISTTSPLVLRPLVEMSSSEVEVEWVDEAGGEAWGSKAWPGEDGQWRVRPPDQLAGWVEVRVLSSGRLVAQDVVVVEGAAERHLAPRRAPEAGTNKFEVFADARLETMTGYVRESKVTGGFTGNSTGSPWDGVHSSATTASEREALSLRQVVEENGAEGWTYTRDYSLLATQVGTGEYEGSSNTSKATRTEERVIQPPRLALQTSRTRRSGSASCSRLPPSDNWFYNALCGQAVGPRPSAIGSMIVFFHPAYCGTFTSFAESSTLETDTGTRLEMTFKPSDPPGEPWRLTRVVAQLVPYIGAHVRLATAFEEGQEFPVLLNGVASRAGERIFYSRWDETGAPTVDICPGTGSRHEMGAEVRLEWEVPVEKLDIQPDGTIPLTLESALPAALRSSTFTCSGPDGCWAFGRTEERSTESWRMGFRVPRMVWPAYECDGEQQDCMFLELDPDPDEVEPKLSAGQVPTDANKTTVAAKITMGKKNTTYTVEVSVDAFDAGAGGHTHGAVPEGAHLRGTVVPDSCTVTTDDEGYGENRECVTYYAGQLGGKSKLKGRILATTPEKTGRADVDVALGLGGGSSSIYFELTGQTGSHGDNHNALGTTWDAIANMATEYFDLTGQRLGINDMSLPRGGLFDIDANWSSSPGHSLHRDGHHVDIDRCSPDGSLIEQHLLDVIVEDPDRENRGKRTIEFPKGLTAPACAPALMAKIHYRF